VTGTVHALAIIKDTGTAATSRPAVFVDGRMQVIVAADAATSATVVWVEQLAGPIPQRYRRDLLERGLGNPLERRRRGR
jgi:hypothetical protein